MIPDSFGPTGTDEATGYHMSPLEHQLRADIAVGGRDNGLPRALQSLEDRGQLSDYITGTKDTFERAERLISHPRHPVEWDVYMLVRDDDEGNALPDHVNWLSTSDLSSRVSVSNFGVKSPEEIVVLKSPRQVNSGDDDSYYAWAPTDQDVSICLCPAKWFQQDSSVLCKHEMAALLAINEGTFDVDTADLEPAKKSMVSRRFPPSDPHPHYK